MEYAEIIYIEILTTKVLLVNIFLIELTAKSPLVFLALLALINQIYGQPKKYLKQTNIIVLSNIYFFINKFDIFINKNANIESTYYIAFR